MYLYFEDKDLKNLLESSLKKFSSYSYNKEEKYDETLPHYTYYMRNMMEKLPLNEAITSIVKAYDVYVYMYNNNSYFYNTYIEPEESTMIRDLLCYYNKYFNDKELSDENRRILKIINMEDKLRKGKDY